MPRSKKRATYPSREKSGRASAVLRQLRAVHNPDAVAGMSRFGITAPRVLGIAIPVLRLMAREIGMNNRLAIQLWESGIHEARILGGMIADPRLLTSRRMDRWARGFHSWDLCDQTCMNLFRHSPLAIDKCMEWSTSPKEFVKRAAFALMAVLAVHDAGATNEVFETFLRRIERCADDERNYVMKGVNWALRQIGKRNRHLHVRAVACARRLQSRKSRSSRWIGTDALAELLSARVTQKRRKT